MRSMYHKATRYSYVLSNGSPSYKDDVHSAYIYYFNKTGKNLFDEHEGFVLRCVKWMNKWRYCKNHYNKSFVDFDHVAEFTPFSHSGTPLQQLQDQEEVDCIYKKIKAYHSGGLSSIDPNNLIEFLFYLERGYQVKEICDLMKITKGVAYNYKAKLKSILRPMTNPFAGNPAPVSKKILRSTYNTTEKYNKYYEYNIDRNCDANEYYALYVHKDKDEWILIKEAERDYAL